MNLGSGVIRCNDRCRRCSYRGASHLLILFFALLMICCRRAQPLPLTPLGSIRLFSTSVMQQMVFDPTNQTLYIANPGQNNILQVAPITSAPLLPLAGAPWTFSVVADGDVLSQPAGIAGWPRYAIGPYSDAMPSSESWVGLWVADTSNHAIRFVHFYRENNVTLVAGSPVPRPGAKDGIGTSALLWYPNAVAWARFLRIAVDETMIASTSIGGWTSVVYWSEVTGNCIRQGVPLHNDTTYSRRRKKT